MMSVEMEDIKRVLAICFRDGVTKSIDDLERILSFDMGWMDTETAHEAIHALVVAGWLKNEDGGLSANCELKGIKAPLGWQPRPSRLIEPVINTSSVSPLEENNESQQEEKKTDYPESNDLRAKLERRLVRYISKQSGIDHDEISRRAERKISALNYCTKWLALCLVSREQNLEMNSIIDSLSGS